MNSGMSIDPILWMYILGTVPLLLIVMIVLQILTIRDIRKRNK